MEEMSADVTLAFSDGRKISLAEFQAGIESFRQHPGSADSYLMNSWCVAHGYSIATCGFAFKTAQFQDQHPWSVAVVAGFEQWASYVSDNKGWAAAQIGVTAVCTISFGPACFVASLGLLTIKTVVNAQKHGGLSAFTNSDFWADFGWDVFLTWLGAMPGVLGAAAKEITLAEGITLTASDKALILALGMPFDIAMTSAILIEPGLASPGLPRS